LKVFFQGLVIFLFLAKGVTYNPVYGQDTTAYEKQTWGMAFFNWRLNEKWVYNQDVGIQHTYGYPAFTRFFLRSQINRQLSGLFSLHGGMIFLYKINEDDNNAIELRPWVGGKLRWPGFWRLNFSHYLRIEQRFRHTNNINDWENNFRMRYKLSTDIPINHPSLSAKTFYGVLSYEFLSESFDVDIRFTQADVHRFDAGVGYRQNVANRYEATVVGFQARDEATNNYTLSSLVLFLKYKRYINWL
jgi:hypothetical protein